MSEVDISTAIKYGINILTFPTPATGESFLSGIRSERVLMPSTTIVYSVGQIIKSNYDIQKVASNTGTIVLRKIYPYSEGRTIKIIGTSNTNVIAIAGGGNVKIGSGSPRELGDSDVWTATAINGSWIETAYANN